MLSPVAGDKMRYLSSLFAFSLQKLLAEKLLAEKLLAEKLLAEKLKLKSARHSYFYFPIFLIKNCLYISNFTEWIDMSG